MISYRLGIIQYNLDWVFKHRSVYCWHIATTICVICMCVLISAVGGGWCNGEWSVLSHNDCCLCWPWHSPMSARQRQGSCYRLSYHRWHWLHRWLTALLKLFLCLFVMAECIVSPMSSCRPSVCDDVITVIQVVCTYGFSLNMSPVHLLTKMNSLGLGSRSKIKVTAWSNTLKMRQRHTELDDVCRV